MASDFGAKKLSSSRLNHWSFSAATCDRREPRDVCTHVLSIKNTANTSFSLKSDFARLSQVKVVWMIDDTRIESLESENLEKTPHFWLGLVHEIVSE